MSVVGVDLGFQNSVIAAAGRGGVDVILNGSSNRLNPSMVGFAESRKMGEFAMSGVSSNYKNTVKGLKRLVGLSFDDPRAKREMESLPVECVPIQHSSGPASIGVKIQLAGEEKILPMEAVCGMMIRHMGEIVAKKSQQSDQSGLPIDKLMPQDWVIAIPNYFTDAQRRALLASCEIVGITGVQRLMHENTATALAYGIFKDLRKEFTKEAPANVMFIDMGASAYTVSIVTFEPGKLIVKSAYCDPDLGGRDFDELIAKHVAKDFSNKHKGKLSADPMESPKSRLKILVAAEAAKKTLSPKGVKEARINLEMLLDDLDYHGNLEAADYEKMCEPLLQRLAGPIEAALAEAGISAKDLQAVEIVGGSTRIGCVKRKLQQILGMELSTTMNADESVARGAALQSAILSPRFKVLPYEIVEAQPYPIKIQWEEPGVGMEVDETGSEQPTDSVVMFDRGISFPIVRRVTLRRSGDFTVKAVYDDASTKYGLPAGCGKDVAEFAIKGVTGEERKVRVNVKEDTHGIISLSSAQMIEELEEAEDGAEHKEGEEGKTEEKKKKIKKTNLDSTTSRPLEWSAAEIAKANEGEVAMANQDRLVKETSDKRNELESYIYDMRDKITSDSQLGPFGTEDEKAAFMAKNEAMETWLYELGFDAKKSVYAEKLVELKALGDPIEKRHVEAEGREHAVKTLKSTLELYQQWNNESQANEAYAHITDEEREKVGAACDATSTWMYELLDKQGGLAPNQDPILTVSDLVAKNAELNKICGPIMRKPMPKKKEEPKKEEPPAENGEAEKKEGDLMDVEQKEKEGEAEAKMETD